MWQALSKLAPSERKVVIEREARREGTLVLYGATGLDRAQFWIAEFNKRYPDVKVEFVRLQAAELYQKIATERRTGQLRADLVITTITYLDLLKDVGALAPYETSEWKDFDPRFRMGAEIARKHQGWGRARRIGRERRARSSRSEKGQDQAAARQHGPRIAQSHARPAKPFPAEAEGKAA